MWTLQEEFARIEIGKPSQIRNLKLFPLIRRNTTQPLDYLLLEDGIAQGKVRAGKSVRVCPSTATCTRGRAPSVLTRRKSTHGRSNGRAFPMRLLRIRGSWNS